MGPRIGAPAIGTAARFVSLADAAEILVRNADFEAGGLTDGAYLGGHVTAVPGWDASGGSGTGQWNPTAKEFSDHAAHGVVGWATGDVQARPGVGMLAQTLVDTILQPETRYALTLDVGGFDGGGDWGFQFGLIADLGPDGAVLACRSGGVLSLGAMRTMSLVFETGGAGDHLGKTLTIGLGGSGSGAAYDNVRLRATPLTPRSRRRPDLRTA